MDCSNEFLVRVFRDIHLYNLFTFIDFTLVHFMTKLYVSMLILFFHHNDDQKGTIKLLLLLLFMPLKI